jgi:hypothetical protein
MLIADHSASTYFNRRRFLTGNDVDRGISTLIAGARAWMPVLAEREKRHRVGVRDALGDQQLFFARPCAGQMK